MKRFFLFIVGLWICGGVFAQEGKEIQLYRQAEEAYKIGRFEEAIALLSDNLDDFSVRTKETSLKLLALCYLEEDKTADAERYVSMLLKSNPYYTASFSDPLRFADMIERLKKGQVTITTASQQAEVLEEAPVPVTLITEEMIKISGAKNLADLLALYVPGLSLVEGSEMNMAMHGVYSSSQEKILIMLDGHRLNSRTTNSEAPDYRTSLAKIKQIEVLRGPASSLYGNVALTAVVNIITKRGRDIDGVKVSAGYGNNKTYTSDFLIGKSVLGVDVMAWMSVYSSQGEKRNVDISDPEFYGKVLRSGSMYINGYNRKPAYDLGATLQWNDFRLLFNKQHSKKTIPYVSVFYPSLYDYDRYRMINGSKPGHSREATHMELSYEKTWNRWSGKAVVFVDMESCSYYDIAGDTILPSDRFLPVNPGEVIEPGMKEDICDYGSYQVQSWNDYTYGGTLQANYNFQKNDWKGSLLLGMQVENYIMKDNTMVIGDHFDRIVVTYSDKNKSMYTGSETNFSTFAQLKLTFDERFIFNGGVRYDFKHRYNNRNLNEISPRLSLIYKVTPFSSLKLGYSHSFVDAPFFYRATTIATYAGGNKLDAEQMDAVQLNYNQNIKEWNLKYDCNLYYNALQNIIYFGPADESGDVMSNAGSLKVMGIENVFSYDRRKWYAQLNFSYQRILESTRYAVTNSHIHGVSDFMLNLLGRYKIWENRENQLDIRGNMSFQSRQYAPLVSDYIYKGDEQVLDADYQLDSRAIFNLGLDYRYKRAQISFDVYNLFNTQYYQGGSLYVPMPQQKLNFMFDLSYSF